MYYHQSPFDTIHNTYYIIYDYSILIIHMYIYIYIYINEQNKLIEIRLLI